MSNYISMAIAGWTRLKGLTFSVTNLSNVFILSSRSSDVIPLNSYVRPLEYRALDKRIGQKRSLVWVRFPT